MCACASVFVRVCVREYLWSKIRAPKSRSESNYLLSEHATRYHAKACNRHVGPLDDACERGLPPLGVKMSCMYEVAVTTGEPAGAIISPMTTTAHGPNTSDIVR